MLLPQELASRSAIPALRSMVAKRLMEKYGLSQRRAAKLLGVTQPAVSNYVRSMRATSFSVEGIEEVERMCDEIAFMIAKGSNTAEVIKRFRDACDYILSNRLVCKLHQELEPELDIDSCHVCDGEKLISIRK